MTSSFRNLCSRSRNSCVRTSCGSRTSCVGGTSEFGVEKRRGDEGEKGDNIFFLIFSIIVDVVSPVADKREAGDDMMRRDAFLVIYLFSTILVIFVLGAAGGVEICFIE